MFRNYLKVALRYLARNKGYTAINVFGLALGITCCVLIMLFVRNEWSYDNFHSKSDRIYRLWQQEKYQGEDFINTVTPLSAATEIQQTYPEVESVCRIFSMNPMIRVGNTSFTDAVRMVDSTFFTVFDFGLTGASRNNPFATANSVLLTPATAGKYFGKEDPMGKQIEMQIGAESILFTVGGIVSEAPEASSIKYNLLISYANAKRQFRPSAFANWFNVYTESYVMLKKGVDPIAMEAKFDGMIKQHLGEDYQPGAFLFHLQPMTKIHLGKDLPQGNEPISDPKYSYILATIGIILLLVACINFIILSVGRSTTRALEVGVRKVMGAEKQQLVRQFWGEALLVTLAAVIIGLVMAAAFLQPFNSIVGRELSFTIDPVFIAFCMLMIGVIAMIAGIYPAVVLSGFKPVEVLKGKLRMKGNTGLFRQSLIVGQFVASIAMIICTIAVSKQMDYLQNKDLGYAKEQVVVVETNKSRREGNQLAERYRQELLKYPQVADVAVSLYTLAETPWVQMGFTDDKKVYKSFQYNSVDANFVKTMGLKMAAGRSFSEATPGDVTTAAIVNEAFVKSFGLVDPIGKKLPGPFEQQIIGVIKDFNYMSLHNEVQPLLLTIQLDSVFRRTENISFALPPQPRLSVRLKGGDIASNIAMLRDVWKNVAPGQDFDLNFLDESIAAQYKAEQRTSTIVTLASGISIFIACMGLFGLATLAVTRRTKEIGVRKVLGASVGSIVRLLSRDFVRLIIIAAIIAFPLAWWFMGDWLKDFAYRVTVNWWIYLLAALLALAIALVTIGVQAIRAAMANPVKSLRTE